MFAAPVDLGALEVGAWNAVLVVLTTGWKPDLLTAWLARSPMYGPRPRTTGA